jgi:chromate reductase, NAD(P)H dehydrogenase (quinone)
MIVLGLCGSLRAASYNTAALRAAGKLMPSDMRLEIDTLEEIPAFNGDVLASGFPAPVARLRERIARADGLLFASPEYNYSMSGVLKNAIDWISRPPDQPFHDKPMAIISASMGVLGGVRSQHHLRQSMVFLNGQVLNRPEVIIGQAQNKFDSAGNLVDDATRQIIVEQMAALRAWILRLKAVAPAVAAA